MVYLIIAFTLISTGFRQNSFQILVIIFIFLQINRSEFFKFRTYILVLLIGLISVGITAALRWSGGLSEVAHARLEDIIFWTFSRSGSTDWGMDYVFDFFNSSNKLLYGKSYIIDIITILPGYQPNFGLWIKNYLGQTWAGGSLMIGDAGIYYINFGFLFVYILAFFNAIFLNLIYNSLIKKITKGIKYLIALVVVGITLNGFGDISGAIYSTGMLLFINYIIFLRG